MAERPSGTARKDASTLSEVAVGEGPAARAAAALVEAGVPATTTLAELNPGRVTRELAEKFARELAELYRALSDVYSNAFIETSSDLGGVEDTLERRVPWWRRLVRAARPRT